MYPTTPSCTADSQPEHTYKELVDEINQIIAFDHQSIRDERFIKGIYCPHCFQNSRRFISQYTSYGTVNGTKWRRYKCKQCQRIFSDLTNTMFHRSRNVKKWPMFIKLLIVDQLPLRQIADNLEIHLNTAYAWRKKFQVFADQLLPIQQHPPTNNQTMDVTVVQVNKSRKGNNHSSPNKTSDSLNDKHQDTVSIFIASVREAPNRVFANVLRHTEHPLPYEIMSVTSTSNTPSVRNSFLHFYSQMRGVSTKNLPFYLSWFRMLRLLHVVNPILIPDEMFKLCLNKDTLSHSKRLIKKLI